MNLRNIAMKNLIRRKGKAVFLLAGLIIGVSTVVAITSFSDRMTEDINHKLEKYGANILIVPRTENLALTYGDYSVGGVSFEMAELREGDLRRIQTIKNAANVAAVGPMVLGVVEVGQRRVLLAGIDLTASKTLKPWWKVDGSLPEENGVILGSRASRILNIQKGSTLVIMGRKLAVTGILNPTGSQDDQLVFAHLKTAQVLLGKTGRISMAEVAALCNACPVEDMVKQISEVLPNAKVMAIQQVVKGRMETLSQFKRFSYGISGVILLIGSLVVLVTMMGSVRERTDEIGIFRAIGFRRSHVIKIVLIEAGIVSGLSGILGYLVGLSATRLALNLFGSHAPVSIKPELAVATIILTLLVGLMASIYPALLAARLDPNEALRAL